MNCACLLKQLKAAGYTKPPVPLIAIWTAPYTPENELKKFKCRICAAGHPGNVTKGVHYFNTFAAAPNCATTRLMHAISTHLKLVVVNYDVATAYLWGDMEESEISWIATMAFTGSDETSHAPPLRGVCSDMRHVAQSRVLLIVCYKP